MTYSIKAIANAIITKANHLHINDLTPLKLQRLLWLAQCEALKDNQLLFDDIFCRWKFGPVVPSLYHALQSFKGSTVIQPLTYIQHDKVMVPNVPVFDFKTHLLIDTILNRYGFCLSQELIELTKDFAGDGSLITHKEMMFRAVNNLDLN